MGVAYLGSLQRFFVEYVSAGNNYGLGENQPGFGAESVLQLRGRIRSHGHKRYTPIVGLKG